MRADRTTLAGIALVCFANLLLEVMITRLFSATMFYHFTFLAVALALFGVAASGVWVFVNEERLAADVPAALARSARRFAIATAVTLIYALVNPIDIIFVAGTSKVPDFTNRQFWQLVLLVVITAAPFFFAGAVVSLGLTFFRGNVNRVYFWDLAGAAAAALIAGLTIGLLGGPVVVVMVIALALVAAALFDKRDRWRWVYAGLGAVVLVIDLIRPVITVPTVKGVKTDSMVFEKWNIFSRITVDDTRTIKIDASAATHIEDLRKLTPDLYKPQISSLAHSLFDPPADHVLVIGPGGGRDVLHALSAGAKRVTGVEVNPIIAETIMKGRFAADSGGLYTDPRVDVVVDDGRSFVRRSDDRYDLVQASLVDTWAATAAGAFALTENTLYTLEAFEDYFAHTSDRGAVTMTRWHTGDGGESARLLILATGALEELGVAPGSARKHLFYAVSPKDGLGTLVAKRNELTPEEVTRLEARCAAQHWNVLVSPRTSGASPLEKFVDAGAWSALVLDANEELRPPTDDRPFFFYFKKFPDLFHPSWKMNDPGLWIMVSLGAVFGLSVVFIVLPLLLRLTRGGVPAAREPRRVALPALIYFGLVGFAFMCVEIALMQRFTLFLGHPSYSLVVILFAVLLSTAIGASLSGRVPVARLGRLMMIGGATLAVIAIVYGVTLGGLLRSWIGLALPVRIVLTAILTAPCGVAMGAMIPSVVRVLGAADSPLVPWGWGINGATSVIGTVTATVIAIYGGFTATFMVGAIGYAGAGALGRLVAARYAALPAKAPASTIAE